MRHVFYRCVQRASLTALLGVARQAGTASVKSVLQNGCRNLNDFARLLSPGGGELLEQLERVRRA
jgi:hypothetical protein